MLSMAPTLNKTGRCCVYCYYDHKTAEMAAIADLKLRAQPSLPYIPDRQRPLTFKRHQLHV